eukprot:SAG11_NODE_3784_length_2229_cov_1.244131_1_plen_590_part_00
MLGALILCAGLVASFVLAHQWLQRSGHDLHWGWWVGFSGLVAAMTLGSIGVSCLRNRLARIEDCSESAGMFMTTVGWCLVFALLCWALAAKLSMANPPVAGVLILCVGIVIGSVGAACVQDDVAGVDHCNAGIGATMTSIGWSLVGLVVLAIALALLPDRFPHIRKEKVVAGTFFCAVATVGLVIFIVGLACYNDSLAGAENCHEGTGRTMALAGAMVVASVTTPCVAYGLGKCGTAAQLGGLGTLLLLGLLLGSYGTACEDCTSWTTTLLTAVGWATVFCVATGVMTWFAIYRMDDAAFRDDHSRDDPRRASGTTAPSPVPRPPNAPGAGRPTATKAPAADSSLAAPPVMHKHTGTGGSEVGAQRTTSDGRGAYSSQSPAQQQPMAPSPEQQLRQPSGYWQNHQYGAHREHINPLAQPQQPQQPQHQQQHWQAPASVSAPYQHLGPAVPPLEHATAEPEHHLPPPAIMHAAHHVHHATRSSANGFGIDGAGVSQHTEATRPAARLLAGIQRSGTTGGAGAASVPNGSLPQRAAHPLRQKMERLRSSGGGGGLGPGPGPADQTAGWNSNWSANDMAVHEQLESLEIPHA